MEHIKTETTNEITYYIVPENTRLYRGDTELYMRDMQLENTPTFFGLEKSRVKNYGMLFSFITLKELRLVALDKPNQAFFDQSPSDIKSILNAQFGLINLLAFAKQFEKRITNWSTICAKLGMTGI